MYSLIYNYKMMFSIPVNVLFLKYTHLILILQLKFSFIVGMIYFFHLISLTLFMFSYLICSFFRQHIIYSCFVSNLTISILKNVFRLFTFNVNIYAVGFISDILLLVSHLSHLILIPFAFFSCFLWH